MRMGWRTVRCIGAALMLSAGPAWAEGSLGLDEVLEVAKGTPDLGRQIEVELRKRDLKVKDVICSAARHGNQWKFLGGGRAAPYQCEIGDRTLRIEADRTYYDINGKRLGEAGKASEHILIAKAKAFRETNLRWSWTDQ